MTISICSTVLTTRGCRQRRLHQILAAFTLGLVMSWTSSVAAQVPNNSSTSTETAPPEFVNRMAQIDAAASKGDLDTVMRLYSSQFTNSDGLTYATLKQTLSDLWKRYPDLTYKTTVDSWEQQGNSITTVTTTTITGSQPSNNRDLKLSATITARQRFEDDKIVEQQILSEQSNLTSGEKPPSVTINLPQQVSPGQQFDFDAVVTEPLGERLLLGAAIEEPVEAKNYLNPSPIELELLSSGGLFKLGRAPATEGDRWISAVIVRSDGITATTQRLRVANQTGN